MRPDSHDVLWLDRWRRLSISELALFSGLTEAELHELVDYGALTPANREVDWAFSADCVYRVRKACRLRDDLELDTQAMALALMLFDRIDDLEAQVAALKAGIPAGFTG
jgi:chaperone modulatory protein CbpM